jgi:coenzyme F420-reducing hydrogenase beta subunit
MKWSAQGEWVPEKMAECHENCSLCMRVCPFFDGGLSIDDVGAESFGNTKGIRWRAETGYFSKCYAGYSLKADHRSKGSSGGMATWFLEALLDRHAVDAVICVTPERSDDRDRLFRFDIVSEAEHVRAAAGSKYYPVEISEALVRVLHGGKDRRYAVIGLPCLIYGLKRAMHRIPRLRRRVVFTLGLVCGQLPNRFYTEFLGLESGVEVKSLGRAEYRIKDESKGVGNYAFCASNMDGRDGRRVYWMTTARHLWKNQYFTHHACHYCDDVFCECADVVFMDAWLPEYSTSRKGHSLMIVRSTESNEILERGVTEGSCRLENLSVARVIQSQAGVIFRKKHLIKGRLYWAQKTKKRVPKKRLLPDARAYFGNLLQVHLQSRILAESKRLWPRFCSDRDNRRFKRAMAGLERQRRLAETCQSLLDKFRRCLIDRLRPFCQ